ncbi:MAG: TonB-dependent receptor [Bacteroidales bacterium]
MKKKQFKESPWARALLVLLLFLVTGFQYAGAQIKVTGVVTDNNKMPMPGVNVQIKGTTTGGMTDAEGKYTVDVSDPNATLVFSYIGFTNQEIALGGRTSVDVEMQESSENIEEVVITGYGTTKKVTSTGAVVAAKGEDIKRAPVTNLSQGLVGTLPGLTSTTSSGEPGYDGANLIVRGVNTIGDNRPLVVVDGIPNRDLERINPNDVENITILKDASAAIYGSQAANGVILVTTKRGQTGKPTITFNGNMGWAKPTRVPEMADAQQYASMLNEIAYYGAPQLGRNQKYTEEDLQLFQDGSDPWGHPNTDWFGTVFKPWSAQNNANLSVNGGSEALKYFLSLGTKFQDGVYENSATYYKQYDLRTNIDAKITKSISLGLDLSGRMENRHFPTRSAGSIFRMLMRGKPDMPAFWPNGDPGPDIEYGDNPAVTSTDATGYDNDKRYVFNSNLRLNIQIPWVKGLTITANGSVDKDVRFDKRWETPWYLYTWDGNDEHITVKGKRGLDAPQLTETMEDQQDYAINAYVTYETSIAGMHNLKIMAGTERRTGNGDDFWAFRKNYISTAVDQLFAGATDEYMSNSGSAWQYALMSYFGRVNYDYGQKYLVEFVWRYDGSDKFGSGNRFGFFPGISAGWRMSEEGFWKNNISFINNFKLRGSWGQTGNDRIDPYQFMSTYGYVDNRSYVYGQSVDNKLLIETVVPNPAVTWEVATSSDIGFDANLLNNKLAISFDYFHNYRKQMLISKNASIPASAGITPPKENLGEMSNNGFEFMVGYASNIGEFKYNVSVNGSYAKNKIEFWDETPGIPEYQKTTGYPYGSELHYESMGVFADQAAVDAYPHWAGAQPGDVIFKDYNDDGVIDGLDRRRTYLTTTPRYVGGLNISLQYKQFDFAMLVQGAAGVIRYINPESGTIGNYYKEYADNRWTPENPSTTYPRAWERDNEYWRSQGNTFWVKNSDYLRVKNLELGYNLPASINKKIGIQAFRVYFSAFNMITFDKLKLIDPELEQGTSYPLSKVLNGGITLTF